MVKGGVSFNLDKKIFMAQLIKVWELPCDDDGVGQGPHIAAGVFLLMCYLTYQSLLELDRCVTVLSAVLFYYSFLVVSGTYTSMFATFLGCVSCPFLLIAIVKNDPFIMNNSP